MSLTNLTIRERLQQLGIEFLHGLPVHLPAESIDAILTILIESLPEKKEAPEDTPYAQGFFDGRIQVIDQIKAELGK
jgi:hypothetical protein